MTDPKPPEDTLPADPAKKPQLTAAEKRGPIRNTLESLGMAVLMAVLLKYFALEAYVIPTPSMQPTMMGSPEAGESDRILVDKIYYLIHEPKRWDIAVFRYPVRQVQSYVKRIVGVGGDRLKIAGGNLYNVAKDGGNVEICRKPERIQRTLWREMYPMRRKLELYGTTTDPDSVPKKSDVFGRHFRGRRDQNWTIDGDGAFVGKPSSGKTIRLSYNEVRNNYTDGYDLGVANTLRRGRNDVGDYAVQDIALDFEFTPANPEKVSVEILIAPSNVTFGLEIEKGQAKLVAQRKTMPVKKLESKSFPFELPKGEATHIRFEHLDDELIAFRDGSEVQRLLVDDMRILDEITINAEVAKDTGALIGKVTPRITVVDQGSSKFAEVRVERDLHYTRSSLPKDMIIEVPEGHFFMMGDNTLGSADGRDWTALEIGVKDGWIVPPNTPGARVLWGNKRPKAFGSTDPPHDDDNPVPMMTTDDVVFVDDMGQFHALKGKVDKKGGWAQRSGKYPEGRVEFLSEPPFIPTQKAAMFVPRQHIQGRPIARFLRSLGGLKFTAWIR